MKIHELPRVGPRTYMAIWLPIDTAPKYEDILFFREDAGVFVGRITTCAEEMTDEERERCEIDEESIWAEDVFGYAFGDTFRCDGDLIPTHWMPLPPGVKSNKEKP